MNEFSAPISVSAQQQLLEARILRVVNAAAAKLEPHYVLTVLCTEICKVLNADAAAFGRLNARREAIEIIAEYRPNNQSALGVVLPLDGNNVTRQVMRERQPVVISDAKNEQTFGTNRETAMRLGICSIMIVPIMAGAEVIGTLGVDSYTPRQFSVAEQELAMNVVQSAIPALKQTHMIEALRNELEERHLVEQALRKSQNRFIELVNNVDGIVFEGEIKDGISRLTFVSQRTEQILGYSVDWWFAEPEWQTKPVHPDDQKFVVDSMQSSAENQVAITIEYRMIRADGSLIWVKTSAKVENDGTRLFWRGLTTDITAVKKQQLLEQDRNHALELTAQGASIGTVLESIASLLHRQFGLPCGITEYHDNQIRLLAEIDLPKAALPLLQQIYLSQTATEMRQTLRQGRAYAFAVAKNQFFAAEVRAILIAHNLHHAVLFPMRLATGAVRGGMMLLSATPFELVTDPRISSSCDLAAIAIERQRLITSLEHQALHDSLTGLANRTLYNTFLEQTMGYAQQHKTSFALLHIDLDGFKQINDTHGHSTGDALLIAVARTLEACIAESDLVARLGGDEFCIIATQTSTPSAAVDLLERLKQALSTVQLEPNIRVSASVGYAIFPANASSADTLYRAADKAMYHHKQTTRVIPPVGTNRSL